MVLNPDFREFIESLNGNNVDYLVVGGYAVALHGHPRYTKDIDIWVQRTPENARRLMREFRSVWVRRRWPETSGLPDLADVESLG